MARPGVEERRPRGGLGRIGRLTEPLDRLITGLSRPVRVGLTALLVVVGLAVPTWTQTMPEPSEVDAVFAPNIGDPVLLMWVWRHEVDTLTSDPFSVLDANIYHPREDTVAWSDNMLLYAPVFGAASAVGGGNPVFAFNWTNYLAHLAGALTVFLLARWMLGSVGAAFVAALLFTITPYRTVLSGHTQLTGFLAVPLALWFFGRFLRHRRWRDAVGVGLAAAACWYTATYYAVLVALVVPIVFAVWLVQTRWRPGWVADGRLDRRLVGGFAVMGAVAGLLVAPTVPAYLRAQETGLFDRHPGEILRARWDYFVQFPPSRLYRWLWGEEGRVGDQGGYWPGVVLIALLVVAALFAWRSWRRRVPGGGQPGEPAGEAPPSPFAEFMVPLVAAAALCSVLMFGPVSSPFSRPFRLLRAVVPGFDSLRDTGRFWLFVVMVLALVAGWGTARLLQDRGPAARFALVAAVGLAAVVDLSYPPLFATIDRSPNATAVYEQLARLEPGVVTEVPAPLASASYPYVQPPRQLNSLIDGNPRLEGYSGAYPRELEPAQAAATMLPSQAGLDHLRSLGVRYVIVHAGQLTCAGQFSLGEAQALLIGLDGAEGVERVITGIEGTDDAIVVLEAGAPPDPPELGDLRLEPRRRGCHEPAAGV